MRNHSSSTSTHHKPSDAEFEILDAAELASRLKVRKSWVDEQSKACRTFDPIPVFRLGKHKRYRWGSPEMNGWLSRRVTTTVRRPSSKRSPGPSGPQRKA